MLNTAILLHITLLKTEVEGKCEMTDRENENPIFLQLFTELNSNPDKTLAFLNYLLENKKISEVEISTIVEECNKLKE